MNIIDIQDNLKNLPENALMQEFQQPTGNAPQFLILGELKRRKQMREDYQRQQNSDMKTVAEETITGAGVPQEGIMQMARSMTPKTNMAQNTGMAQATPVQPTQAPQMMSDGGVVRFANGGMSGGTLGAIASLKVNQPEVYEMYKDDDDYLLKIAQLLQQTASEDNKNYFETLEAPRKKNFFNTMTGFESGQAESSMFNDPTAGSVRRALAELDASQPDRIQQAMDASQANLAERGAYLGSDMTGSEDPIFSEGSPVEYINETPEGGLPRTADVMTDPANVAVPNLGSSLVSPEDRPEVPFGSFNLDGGSSFPAGDENISASLPKLPSVASMPPASSEMDSTYQQIVDANNRQDMMERMVGLEPNEEIYTSETDRRRAALADPNSSGRIDALDGLFNTRNNDEQRNDLFSSFGSVGKPTAMDRLNKRASDYRYSDLFTPREDVYDGSIYEMLTLQEDSELDNMSNLLAATTRANEQDQETNMFDADLAELTPVEIELRRQEEASRMKRINEIPEPRIAGGLENFVTTEVDRLKSGLNDMFVPSMDGLLPPGSIQSPTQKLQEEVAGINAQLADPKTNEILAGILTRRKEGLVRQLQLGEAQTDTGEFLSNIPEILKQGYEQYVAPGLGLTTAEQAAANVEEIVNNNADADAAETRREEVLNDLIGGAEVVPTIGDMDTGEPLSIPSEEEGGIASLLPPKPKKSSDNAVVTKQTSGGTSGAGFGSLDSRIATMLSERQKQSESDKWMALAQAGFQIMSSKSPTLLGAVGEGGQAGLKALGASKKGAQDFEIDMLKLQAQLDIAQQRARSSGLKGNKVPSGIITALQKQLDNKLAELGNLDPPVPAGIFSKRKDPDRIAREALQNDIRILRGQINYGFKSQGVPMAQPSSDGTGSGRKQV